MTELQQFAHQLADWTELVITHGRTPFRKVSRYAPLRTAQGLLHPPLIFWINRQSMMAGGVLLVPEQDLACALSQGRSCAEALGLRHFATWETDRVRIWRIDGERSEPHQEFPIGLSDRPEHFRQLLNELLNALKLVAVLGTVPKEELSAHYLHNLFLLTLEFSTPPRQEHCRRLSALGEEATATPDHLAAELNRQTLLQLLTLLWHDQLPESILPEKLGETIECSLDNLPPSLKQALSHPVFDGGTELPYDCAICFHHLLLRLRQLGWSQPRERALHSIRLLIDTWYPASDEPLPDAPLLIHPPGPDPSAKLRGLLSDSAPLLAAQALLENLLGETVAEQYYGNLFQFGATPLPQQSIAARLLEVRPPARQERQTYQALMRISWPNRRFRMTGDTPRWSWETLHLLGLCHRQQRLHLTLPLVALQTPVDAPLWQILHEHFQIRELRQLPNTRVQLSLCRAEQGAESVSVHPSQGYERQVAPCALTEFRARLMLTLALPEELLDLLDTELVWHDQKSLQSLSATGLSVYVQSRLAQQTWQLLSDRPAPQSPAQIQASAQEVGWPLPDRQLLIELAQRTNSLPTESTRSSIDQLLAELLQCPMLNGLDLSLPYVAHEVKRLPIRQNQRQQIFSQLYSEGIPSFPEKYLYLLDEPTTIRFLFSPPLHIESQLLGQFVLRDAKGETLQIVGEDLCSALLLCSDLGKSSADLPTERTQLAEILECYASDLRKLQNRLKALCHEGTGNPAAAQRLASKIWRELMLPAEKWFAD